MSVQKHPYHLVDPSPWPILGALAALVLAFGCFCSICMKTMSMFLLVVLLFW